MKQLSIIIDIRRWELMPLIHSEKQFCDLSIDTKKVKCITTSSFLCFIIYIVSIKNKKYGK